MESRVGVGVGGDSVASVRSGGGLSGKCQEWGGTQWQVSGVGGDSVASVRSGGGLSGKCQEWGGTQWQVSGVGGDSVASVRSGGQEGRGQPQGARAGLLGALVQKKGGVRGGGVRILRRGNGGKTCQRSHTCRQVLVKNACEERKRTVAHMHACPQCTPPQHPATELTSHSGVHPQLCRAPPPCCRQPVGRAGGAARGIHHQIGRDVGAVLEQHACRRGRVSRCRSDKPTNSLGTKVREVGRAWAQGEALRRLFRLAGPAGAAHLARCCRSRPTPGC